MNLLLIFTGFILAFIVFYYEHKIRNLSAKSKNNVHFYVARDKNGKLWLYINKPIRAKDVFISAINIDLTYSNCNYLGLNKNDYADLKWEDEPIEVFINMED